VSLAIEVSRKLVLYYKRPGSQLQFSSALKAEKLAEKNFSGLYKWLIKNLNKSISVKDMAKFVMMSDRNFARIFKAELGLTPAKYLERLRIDKARELILSGDQLLQEVAEISGFSNEEKLRRAFIRHFGLSPSQYRLHFTK